MAFRNWMNRSCPASQDNLNWKGRVVSYFRAHYTHQICRSSCSFFAVYTPTYGLQEALRICRCFFISRLVQRSSQVDSTVQFWNMTLKFELLILILVRSFRYIVGLQTVYSCADGKHPLDVRSRPHQSQAMVTCSY